MTPALYTTFTDRELETIVRAGIDALPDTPARRAAIEAQDVLDDRASMEETEEYEPYED